MRQIILVLVAAGMVAASATSNLTLSQGGTMVCRPGGACIQTTTETYNRCVDLALRRGQNLSKGDRHNFDLFVYACVAGRVRG